MDDLAAWLTQIWDEQEAIARSATEGPWKWGFIAPPHKYGLTGDRGRILIVPSRAPDIYPNVDNARFMEANDPNKVLAQIEADRKILARCTDYLNRHFGDDFSGDGLAEDVVKGLALGYADRPGYQEAWKPE